jgi:hypothetical protein
MKKIFKFFLLFVFHFLNFQNAFSQLLIFPNSKIEYAIPSPTIEDYENVIVNLKKDSKIFDVNFYSKIKLINKKTEKEMLLKDFAVLDQDVFIIDFAIKKTKEMNKIQILWKSEAIKINNPNYAPIKKPKIENEKQNPANKDDVEKFCLKLNDIRSNFAKQYEKFYEEFMEKNKEIINNEELNFNFIEIKKLHDTHQLIKR